MIRFLVVSLSLLFSLYLPGQNRETVKKSTDVLMFLNPAVGAVTSLIREDYKGTREVIIGGVSSVAVCYLLKYTVRKERPDGSDHRAFPSNHTSMSVHGATFLQKRYGSAFGLPAYAVAAYVGWGRIYAKRHDIWDVLGGAAIGTAGGLLLTTPFARRHNLSFSPSVSPEGHPLIYLSLNF